ncbi:hypothetical protein PRZ48_010356 [Zasmidium cellare]|uniref:SET domain-containing protein n=1 Tax=Zasmidium cellare TaxID=395010 RepID=A0ABR0E8E7_ZASCE|nr:hypothetical protein PRZ48_010356 [Zasmidium cellare]
MKPDSKKPEAATTKTPPPTIPPPNWPPEITYLTDQIYTPAVSLELRSKLSRSPSDNISWIKLASDLIITPCPLVSITTITDEKHPACGQRGLFAAQHLIPDSFICLYMGEVHCNSLSDTDPNSDYDLNRIETKTDFNPCLDSEIGLSVDASKAGNESRCTNDYRGVAERPNAEFRDCFIQVPSLKRADGLRWERRVGIFVLSAGKAGKRKAGIKAGEEILVSYGKAFWEGRKTLATFRKDFEMLRIAEAALEL